MNFSVPPANAVVAFRRAGYTFQRHTDEPGKMSFVREMAQGGYPRFHAYVTQKPGEMHVSIHIDHTKHTHGNATRHHGEYGDDGALGPEVERLKQTLG